MVTELKVKYISEDDWGRKLYRNVNNKEVYAEVDGTLHTITRDGEPCYPIRKDIKIIIEQ